MLLCHILISTLHGKNIKKLYKNYKFKISVPTWKDKFELPDGSYSVLDIQITLSISSKNIKQRLIILQQESM